MRGLFYLRRRVQPVHQPAAADHAAVFDAGVRPGVDQPFGGNLAGADPAGGRGAADPVGAGDRARAVAARRRRETGTPAGTRSAGRHAAPGLDPERRRRGEPGRCRPTARLSQRRHADGAVRRAVGAAVSGGHRAGESRPGRHRWRRRAAAGAPGLFERAADPRALARHPSPRPRRRQRRRLGGAERRGGAGARDVAGAAAALGTGERRGAERLVAGRPRRRHRQRLQSLRPDADSNRHHGGIGAAGDRTDHHLRRHAGQHVAAGAGAGAGGNRHRRLESAGRSSRRLPPAGCLAGRPASRSLHRAALTDRGFDHRQAQLFCAGRRPAAVAGRDLRPRTRQGARRHRRQRQRQIDPGALDRRVLAAERRRNPPGRRGAEAVVARAAGPSRRLSAAGRATVRRDGGGKHRPPGRGRRRAGRRRRALGARPRDDPALAAGLRHAARSRRRGAVRRPAPAHRARPRGVRPAAVDRAGRARRQP